MVEVQKKALQKLTNCFMWGKSPNIPLIATPYPVFQGPLNKPIRKLYSEGTVNFIIDEEYKLFSWGQDDRGMLGLDSENISSELKLVKVEDRFLKVSIGKSHVLALSTGGKVYSWGSNEFSQLGYSVDPRAFQATPGPVQALSDFKCVWVGAIDDSSYAITAENELFSWGQNADMQLGNNSTSSIMMTPSRVNTSRFPVRKVIKCGGFLMALCKNLEKEEAKPVEEEEKEVVSPPPEASPLSLKSILAKKFPTQSSKPHGSHSNEHSKDADRASNPDSQPEFLHGKNEYSDFLLTLAKTIERLKSVYDILFQIDQTMIFAFQSKASQHAKHVINMLNVAGEAIDDFGNKEMRQIRETPILDPNLKEQFTVLEKVALDGLNLRKVNYVCGRMFLRCVKLKSNSFEEVRGFLKKKNPAVPNKTVMDEFQGLCYRATARIRDDSIEIESLQLGMNDLSSYA